MFARLTASTLLLLFCLTACSAPTTQQDSQPAISPSTPTGSQPAASTNAIAAERVVALTSLGADILHRLDADKLVGIPGSRLLRADARFQDLTTVSEGRTPPNLEKITALEPDLVIGAVGFHDRTLEQLEAVGIDTLAVNVKSWPALAAVTQEIAEAIAADPEALLASYRDMIPSTETETSPSTLVLVSREPILAPTQNSWAGDLLNQFNVKNAIANFEGSSAFQGYATLSPEKVLAEDPETIVLVDAGDGAIDALKSEPFWQELQAVKSDRVYTFDYYGLVNPGSIDTITQACEQLAEMISQADVQKNS
ncbi:MAG: ABC transporter substrate-binding protein [Cyanobacteria bacterium J06641_5]